MNREFWITGQQIGDSIESGPLIAVNSRKKLVEKLESVADVVHVIEYSAYEEQLKINALLTKTCKNWEESAGKLLGGRSDETDSK